MNCLIIDDNKVARTVLKHLVKNFEFLTLIADCEDVIEAINVMNRNKIDLLLLDIEMPKVSGLDFLKISKMHPIVILITSKPEYALTAFEYNVVDFLVKPIKEERFLKAISKAKEIYDANTITDIKSDYFFIREKGVSVKLLISDITFVQALGDYINIHTKNTKHTIHYSITQFEKKLSSSNFMRIHRSYIIALDKVDKLEDGTAYIANTGIPIADNYKSNLSKRLNTL